MFGYVMANGMELSKEQKARYGAVYCGICRSIREHSGNVARLGLSYDMAFLALLLMSLYEPEETVGKSACLLHPFRAYTENELIRYAADMNVLLGYYNCMDDYLDEKKPLSKAMAGVFGKSLEEIAGRYPRQAAAVEECIRQLSLLEKENCPDPDALAGCFGQLMGELLVWQEDRWAETLRSMGYSLGRYIYLADAVADYAADKKKNRFNPFLMSGEEDPEKWENYLVLAMGRCAEHYEHLPLVQDKEILDNILYSGIWLQLRRKQGKKHDRSL